MIQSSVEAATTISDISIALIHLISCVDWARVDALFPPFQHESYNTTFHVASYYYKVLGTTEHHKAAELYLSPLMELFNKFDRLWNFDDENISPLLAGFCPMSPAGMLFLTTAYIEAFSGLLGNETDVAFYTVGATWSDVDFVDSYSEAKHKHETLYVASEPWERLKECFTQTKPILVAVLATYLR